MQVASSGMLISTSVHHALRNLTPQPAMLPFDDPFPARVMPPVSPGARR